MPGRKRAVKAMKSGAKQRSNAGPLGSVGLDCLNGASAGLEDMMLNAFMGGQAPGVGGQGFCDMTDNLEGLTDVMQGLMGMAMGGTVEGMMWVASGDEGMTDAKNAANSVPSEHSNQIVKKLPAKVRQRVASLHQDDAEHVRLAKKKMRELALARLKLEQDLKRLHAKRDKLVKGIPGFWAAVLKQSHRECGMSPTEAAVLQHVEKVECESFPNYEQKLNGRGAEEDCLVRDHGRGFLIRMHVAENKYLSNRVLTKVYAVGSRLNGEGDAVMYSLGTEIHWKRQMRPHNHTLFFLFTTFFPVTSDKALMAQASAALETDWAIGKVFLTRACPSAGGLYLDSIGARPLCKTKHPRLTSATTGEANS
eukprot:Rhum_TRINITY_DN4913_c0_g1::Rhum_TRINITY_DN4913_c0_g1_i1::g.16069::m.16069/K11279/NAP1L1, NRP; nucleosome assembly protein 1-like 1